MFKRYPNSIISLYQDILDQGYELLIRVTGSSMMPFIRSNETVTLIKVPVNRLRKGDIILHRNPNGHLILHRVIKVNRCRNNQWYVQTMGDHTLSIDAAVSEPHILGKVIGIQKHQPFLGFRRIRMNSIGWRIINWWIAWRGQWKLFWKSIRIRFRVARLQGL